MIVLAAAVGALVLGGVLVGLRFTDDRVLKLRRRKVVIVTLRSGAGFKGVLFDSDHRCLVLRNAVASTPGADPPTIAVDGELILLRSEVDYLQRP